MINSKIKSFLFDIGNVILRFDNHRISSRIAEHAHLNENEVYQFIIRQYIEEGVAVGKISVPSFLNLIRSRFKLTMSDDTLKFIFCDIFDENQEMSRLLKFLKKKYGLAVISNTNEMHFAFMQSRFPIVNSFSHYVLSYIEGVKKPSTDIYYRALEKINLKANEIFFVDDQERNILPAKKIGFMTHQFRGIEALTEEMKYLGVDLTHFE